MVEYSVKKATLETALRAIDSFKSKLNDAVKDEADAQKMYGDMAKTAISLSSVDSPFRTMADTIGMIRGQEANHEKLFHQMISNTERAERRLKEELDRLKEEESKKQQVKEPHKRYERY